PSNEKKRKNADIMEIERNNQRAEIESSRVNKKLLYKIVCMIGNLIMLRITTVERIKDALAQYGTKASVADDLEKDISLNLNDCTLANESSMFLQSFEKTTEIGDGYCYFNEIGVENESERIHL
ncbi:9130_t:CDS:2, partial [Gigaspora rosea]